MKQLSKMMLAAVASVALAAPAFAWDFSASGSAKATFNQTTLKASKDSNSLSGGGVGSEGSSLSVSSSHTDGAKSASFSYTLDWDGNLDETVTVSGSNKVGNWTASADVSYNRDRPGCATPDNGTARAGSNANVAGCAGQTGEDTTSVTLTDGTMTIVLGEAGHLSSQNVSTNGAAAGALTWDAADDDAAIGAFVDSFHGVSIGYAISDTMSVTGAYQASGDDDDMCGAGEYMDGETTVGAATHTDTSTTGTGIGFSGTFGPATVGFTMCSASTKDSGSATVDATSNSTASSTMGLGVTIDLGDIDPFLSYGTYTAEGSQTKNGISYSGSEIGLTYALGEDTISVYVGNVEEKGKAAGVDGKPFTASGMEVGYGTTVGPASLDVGYGSTTAAQEGGANDGYSRTDIEVALSYSF